MTLYKELNPTFSIRQPSTLPPPPSTHKMKIEEATSAKDGYEFQDTNTKF